MRSPRQRPRSWQSSAGQDSAGELCGVRVIPAVDIAVVQVKAARRCDGWGGLASKTVDLWRQYSRSPGPAWPRRRPGGLRSATSPGTALSIGCGWTRRGVCRWALPVRRFGARKGQRHLSGLRWSATTGGHAGFESWPERDYLAALDFDRPVAGIASQPSWRYWTGPQGQRTSHAPGSFARRADGSAVMLDCRPVDRRWPADVAKSGAAAAACASPG